MHVQRGSSQQFKHSDSKDKTQQQHDNSCSVCLCASLREGCQQQDYYYSSSYLSRFPHFIGSFLQLWKLSQKATLSQ